MGPTSPELIARLGEEIYERKYKRECEASHFGKFAAVNVRSEDISIGDSADEALHLSRASDPYSLVHLIRVGFPSAFQISYAVSRPYQNRLSR
jgi:hypothetical protein